MTVSMKHVRVDSVKHRDLRISTASLAKYGDNVNFAMLVPAELITAKNFYPIFVQKDSHTGKFFLSAMLGFQEGENLFLDESGWNAEYIPLSVQRQPFLIGQQSIADGSARQLRQVIDLDIDHPRVRGEDGARIFDDDGEPTEYLNNVADMLDMLHKGLLETDLLAERLIQYSLLESMTLTVDFNEHKKYRLENFYNINIEVLNKLSEEAIVSLFRDGTLELIYALIHSQARVSTLIRLKREQDAL